MRSPHIPEGCKLIAVSERCATPTGRHGKMPVPDRVTFPELFDPFRVKNLFSDPPWASRNARPRLLTLIPSGFENTLNRPQAQTDQYTEIASIAEFHWGNYTALRCPSSGVICFGLVLCAFVHCALNFATASGASAQGAI